MLVLIAELMLGQSGYAQPPWAPESRVREIAAPKLVRPSTMMAYRHDDTTKNPKWAAEYLTKTTILGGAKRRNLFDEDTQDCPQARAFTVDYRLSGFDVGHLAPANDFGSQTESDATFTLGNAVPMLPAVNRGVWKRIENEVRSLVEPELRAVHVVTGPAYLDGSDGLIHIKTIGPHGVWVPTHIWKAVLVIEEGWEQTDASTKKLVEVPRQMKAWLVPNTDDSKGDSQQFTVTVDEVEQASGLELFEWLDDELETQLEAGK